MGAVPSGVERAPGKKREGPTAARAAPHMTGADVAQLARERFEVEVDGVVLSRSQMVDEALQLSPYDLGRL